jgi:hypothetical protein
MKRIATASIGTFTRRSLLHWKSKASEALAAFRYPRTRGRMLSLKADQLQELCHAISNSCEHREASTILLVGYRRLVLGTVAMAWLRIRQIRRRPRGMLCRPGVAREHESWAAPIVYPRVRRIASVPRGSRLPFQVANIASAVSWRLAFWRSLMGLVNLKSPASIRSQSRVQRSAARTGMPRWSGAA